MAGARESQHRLPNLGKDRAAGSVSCFIGGLCGRLGLAFAEQEKFAEALDALKHAREFGASGVELLVAMGRCAAGLDRSANAIAYYEEALKLAPRNFVARRALSALGHKPPTPGKESGAVRSRRD